VAATINAEPIVDYKGGVFTDESFSQDTNHIISIVGWETDPATGEVSWVIRNSWGEYWGEMGFMRLVAGKNLLGIEEAVAWATPGSYTVHNFPCSEDGKNCNGKPDASRSPVSTAFYVDPSNDMVGFFQTRLNFAPQAAKTATSRALRKVTPHRV
jgi:Papain family cysteine protease